MEYLGWEWCFVSLAARGPAANKWIEWIRCEWGKTFKLDLAFLFFLIFGTFLRPIHVLEWLVGLMLLEAVGVVVAVELSASAVGLWRTAHFLLEDVAKVALRAKGKRERDFVKALLGIDEHNGR